MEIISARKIRLGLTLKVKRPNGKVEFYTKRSKKAFQNLLASIQGKNQYFLKVYYGRGATVDSKRGYLSNCGDYATKRELLFAFRCFTEKSLLKEVGAWCNEKS